MTKEKIMFISSICLVCLAVAIMVVPYVGARFGFMPNRFDGYFGGGCCSTGAYNYPDAE